MGVRHHLALSTGFVVLFAVVAAPRIRSRNVCVAARLVTAAASGYNSCASAASVIERMLEGRHSGNDPGLQAAFGRKGFPLVVHISGMRSRDGVGMA